MSPCRARRCCTPLNHPGHVRHVATLASPVRLPTTSSIVPLVRLFARRYGPAVDPARLRRPSPVPSTSVRTRDDGQVDWRSCAIEEPPGQTVELAGTHLTIASNPDALRALVRRLAGAQRRSLPGNGNQVVLLGGGEAASRRSACTGRANVATMRAAGYRTRG